jgi:hypothetical protein
LAALGALAVSGCSASPDGAERSRQVAQAQCMNDFDGCPTTCPGPNDAYNWLDIPGFVASGQLPDDQAQALNAESVAGAWISAPVIRRVGCTYRQFRVLAFPSDGFASTTVAADYSIQGYQGTGNVTLLQGAMEQQFSTVPDLGTVPIDFNVACKLDCPQFVFYEQDPGPKPPDPTY